MKVWADWDFKNVEQCHLHVIHPSFFYRFVLQEVVDGLERIPSDAGRQVPHKV